MMLLGMSWYTLLILIIIGMVLFTYVVSVLGSTVRDIIREVYKGKKEMVQQQYSMMLAEDEHIESSHFTGEGHKEYVENEP